MSNSKKISWKRVLLSALCVVLALILVLLLVVTVFMDRLLGAIEREPENRETLSSAELEDLLKPNQTIGEDYTGPVFGLDEITVPTETVEVIENENIVNILLIGQDRRGTSYVGLTDVMMLCTINKETKTLTMTSFLRDLYLKIPGHYRSDKLNVAYPVGGFNMINDTLELNFGVKVDGNLEVDFSSFAKLIDMIGGVDIELSGAEAGHLNKLGYGLRTGMNHLNGEQALAYSRIRSIDSDFQRTNRQRNVITAIVNQFRNASLSQITDTITAALGMVRTNLTDAEIMKYALELAPLLKDLKIVSQHIPVDGTYYYGGVREENIVDCIFIKDFETNRKLIADVLGGDQ